MNKKEVLIQQGKSVSLRSKFHIKFLMKHLLTASYLALAIFVLLQIRRAKNSSDIDALMPLFMDIAWYTSIVFVLIYAMSRSIRLVNVSFGSTILSIVMMLGLLGLSIYITIDSTTVVIDKWKHLSKVAHYLLYVFAYLAGWTFLISFFERKASPTLSKYLFVRAIMISLAAVMSMLALFEANIVWLNKHTTKINIHGGIQTFYLLSIASLFVSVIVISIFIKRKFLGKLKGSIDKRASRLSIMAVLMISVMVLITSRLLKWEEGYGSYLFVGFVAVVVTFVFIFSWFKRNETSSSIVRMTVFSLALATLWIGKMFFEYSLIVSLKFAFPVTMIATAALFLILYFENPFLSKLSEITISSLAWILYALAILMWIAVKGFSKYLELNVDGIAELPFSIIEMLNIVLISMPILLFFMFSIQWFLIQRRIKTSLSKTYRRQKKNKKNKLNVKEAPDA